MTEKGSDLEELKGLQAEAKKRRTERETERSKQVAAESELTAGATETTAPTASVSTGGNPTGAEVANLDPLTEGVESHEVTLQDFADQIGSIVKEMEEAASERPALALLTAFSLGILVGQLFSRK